MIFLTIESMPNDESPFVEDANTAPDVMNNGQCSSISCPSHPCWSLDSSQVEEELVSNNQWIRTFPVEEVRDFQLADTDIRPLINWLNRDREPSTFELFVSGPATKHF